MVETWVFELVYFVASCLIPAMLLMFLGAHQGEAENKP